MTALTEIGPEPADPAAVVALMAALAQAALLADTDVIHPEGLVWLDGALAISDDLVSPDPTLAAPELARSGPTPKTLCFAVGLLAARRAVPVALPGEARSPEAHGRWVSEIATALRGVWRGAPHGDAATSLICRCLALDPFDRPLPRHLITALEPLGLPPPVRPPPVRRPKRGASIAQGTLTPMSATPRRDPVVRRIGVATAVFASGAVVLLAAASCGLGALSLGLLEGGSAPEATEVVEVPERLVPVVDDLVDDLPPPHAGEGVPQADLVVEPKAARPVARPPVAPKDPRNDLLDPWADAPVPPPVLPQP